MGLDPLDSLEPLLRVRSFEVAGTIRTVVKVGFVGTVERRWNRRERLGALEPL